MRPRAPQILIKTPEWYLCGGWQDGPLYGQLRERVLTICVTWTILDWGGGCEPNVHDFFWLVCCLVHICILNGLPQVIWLLRRKMLPNLSLPLVFRPFAAQNAFSPPNLHQPQVFRVFAAQNAISPTNINPSVVSALDLVGGWESHCVNRR